MFNCMAVVTLLEVQVVMGGIDIDTFMLYSNSPKGLVMFLGSEPGF